MPFVPLVPRPPLLLWDSSICLSCHLKQYRHHATTSLARPTNRPDAIRRKYMRSLHTDIALGAPWTTAFRTKPVAGPYLAPRPFSTASRSSLQEYALERSSDLPLTFRLSRGSNRDRPSRSRDKRSNDLDVRSLLKQWQPLAESVSQILPLEPQGDALEGGRLINNLTRPEGLDPNKSERNEIDQEQLQGYLHDYDRITGSVEGAEENILLKRGDLVELRARLNTPLLAVFLGISTNKFFQFYTVFGKLYCADYRSADFQINGYFRPAELDPIMPYIPTLADPTNVDVVIPRNISAPILSKMVRFRSDCEEMYRKYSSAIENAFSNLAHPTEQRYMTLEDIVAHITGHPVDLARPYSPELLFAVSNALTRERFGFHVEQRTYAASLVLLILPKEDEMVVERVQRWLRAYQEESALLTGGFEVPKPILRDAMIVNSFVRKALKLVAESRAFRRSSPDAAVLSCHRGTVSEQRHSKHTVNESTGSVAEKLPFQYIAADSAAVSFPGENLSGRSKLIHSLEFSGTDRDFIRVLKLSASTDALIRHPTYRSLPSVILRAVGVYQDKELREDMCWNLLVELGVVQPYTKPSAFDDEVWLLNNGLALELDLVDQRLKARQPLADLVTLEDSMSHFRKDWGDMQVFCIDSEDTLEVDDGISLERIASEPGNYWIHVHVAHVSAFCSPNHILGRCAEHRLQTLYSLVGRRPMLPNWAASEYSLAPDRPCLTFSAKLSSEGDLLDYTIQPGIIHNVTYISPEKLNTHFGSLREPPNYFTFRCGPEVQNDEPTPSFRRSRELTEDQRFVFRTLEDICTKVRDRRTRTPFMTFANIVEPRVDNVKTAAVVNVHSNPTHARFVLEDPTISFKIDTDYDKKLLSSDRKSTADMVVEQCMLLANVVAAKWASDRNIPIIYTGTRPAVDGLEPITAETREELQRTSWNRDIMATLMSLYAVRILSSSPVEQRMMGISEYAKVTSPLRRHGDLVSCWQLDAVLREEHAIERSLAGRPVSAPAPYLPYQKHELDKHLRVWNSRVQNITWYLNSDNKHWMVQAVARAFYLGEAPLPSPLTCHIAVVKGAVTLGRMRELEFPVMLVSNIAADGTVAQIGDLWEVEIHKVLPYARQIHVKLVKRITAATATMVSHPQC